MLASPEPVTSHDDGGSPGLRFSHTIALMLAPQGLDACDRSGVPVSRDASTIAAASQSRRDFRTGREVTDSTPIAVKTHTCARDEHSHVANASPPDWSARVRRRCVQSPRRNGPWTFVYREADAGAGRRW